MTPADLHALDSYSNHTFGRGIRALTCVGCGAQHTPIDGKDWRNTLGFCPSCAAKRTPTREVIHMFRPLRPLKVTS